MSAAPGESAPSDEGMAMAAMSEAWLPLATGVAYRARGVVEYTDIAPPMPPTEVMTDATEVATDTTAPPVRKGREERP